MTGPTKQPANNEPASVVLETRNPIQNIRAVVQDVEQTCHEAYQKRRELQTMLDDLNGSLSNINVKKIEKLDTRPTTYATDATRTDKLNAHLPYQCDPDGRLSSVDIGECVH